MYQLLELTGSTLEAAAAEFEAHGFIRLRGVGAAITALFEAGVAAVLRSEGIAVGAVLQPLGAMEFPLGARKRIAKVESADWLGRDLLMGLGRLLSRLLGPIVHVSSSYHIQIKGGGVSAPAVDHGGYPADSSFLEPFGQYLLHQDFTGANLPTSPSALTLWVPLNDSPDWNLRLYPGSHRRGMLCNRWVGLDAPELEALGEPVDIRAQRGTAVLFNAMSLHGTSRPGPHRRVSCDIRFFPLCGFLPSQPWMLGAGPVEELERDLPDDGPVLRSPRLEAKSLLGLEAELPEGGKPEDYAWARYVAALCNGAGDAAGELTRFANPELTGETGEVYLRKFHGRPLERQMLQELEDRLAAGPEADERWIRWNEEAWSTQARGDARQAGGRILEPARAARRQPELG